MFQTQGIEGRGGACGRQRRIFHTRKQNCCQARPIKIGMSMPQTGSLGAGGQAALVALRLWVDDVNQKGGLLNRKVELIAYDDQTNPANVPGIYTKLLDVDKVDLLIAPYGTVPTAPIMPMVKQRGLLLMGNFSFQVNAKVQHDMWFNNSPWNDASSWSDGFIKAGQKAGRRLAVAARRTWRTARASSRRRGTSSRSTTRTTCRPPPTSPRSSAASARRGRRWCSSCPTRTTRWRSSAR